MSEMPLSKEAVVLKLLAEGDVMLCLDARCAGVQVPPQHARDPALRLVLNLNFPRPIEVTAEGISTDLSFGGRRTACYIPMAALWAAFDPHTRQGMMWPDSMPAEVLDSLAAQEEAPGATGPTQQPPADPVAPASRPRVIKGKGQRAARTEETSPRQTGHLRVVK